LKSRITSTCPPFGRAFAGAFVSIAVNGSPGAPDVGKKSTLPLGATISVRREPQSRIGVPASEGDSRKTATAIRATSVNRAQTAGARRERRAMGMRDMRCSSDEAPDGARFCAGRKHIPAGHACKYLFCMIPEVHLHDPECALE